MRGKGTTDLRSVISEGLLNEDHGFHNVMVC